MHEGGLGGEGGQNSLFVSTYSVRILMLHCWTLIDREFGNQYVLDMQLIMLFPRASATSCADLCAPCIGAARGSPNRSRIAWSRYAHDR